MSSKEYPIFKVVVAALLLMPLGLYAASPELKSVRPKGAQRGTACVVNLRGERLWKPQELLFYRSGIAVTKIEAVGDKGKDVKLELQVASDAALGEYAFRLRTARGVSALKTFFVGPYPAVAEAEPNSEFATPQQIPLHCTVEGVVKNEDVDYYQVEAIKGHRLSVEIEAVRLGIGLFDPYIAILDAKRFELAASDDTALLLQDGVASAVVPEDGLYVIQVRETSYAGSDNSIYRLHVGTFPRPRTVFPPGGQTGTTLEVTFLGDVMGDFKQSVILPGEPQRLGIYAEQDGETSPSPNWLRVSDFPGIPEKEPNNGRKAATVADGTLPLALNGIVGAEDDIDWFQFTAKKGRALKIRVYARELRSPLDPVIDVRDADGKSLSRNDDASGVDSMVTFKPPKDGDYFMSVRDHLHQGGGTYTYRIELTPVRPKLTVALPVFKKNTQDRQAVVIPRGDRFGALLTVKREGFGGDLSLDFDALPAGVTVKAPNIVGSVTQVPVLFEASGDAPLSGALVGCRARHVDPAKKIEGRFSQKVELVRANPNNTVYYATEVDALAVAVVEAAPFRVELVQPKVPLVRAGTMGLRVLVHRNEGFEGVVRVRMLFTPPGVGATSEITIPKDSSSGLYSINAKGDAALKTWQVAVIAASKVKGGDLWVASDHIDLQIAEPFVYGKLDMAAVQRGQVTEVVCALTQKTPFEGKATVQLLGLPTKVTAEPCTITKDDTEVVFTVKTDEKSPTGQHKSLFCSLDVVMNGETIRHTVGGLGTLRIDPPPKKVAPKKDAPAAPVKKAPAKKRLSRLEQLRLDQEAKGEGE